MGRPNMKTVMVLVILLLMGLPSISLINYSLNTVLAQEIKYKREEVLIIPCRKSASPDNFNWLTTAGWRGREVRWLNEFLFYYNLLNDTIVPWLATKYEYGPKYETIKIYLRKGVTWNDGVPFTAHDIVFTVNYLKKHPECIGAGWVKRWIKDVKAVSDYEVIFWLTRPNCRIHWGFTSLVCFPQFWILPKHIFEHVKEPLKFKNYPPVVTGPYKVVRSTPEETILVRDPNYWGTKVLGVVPQPKYVIFKYVGGPEKEAMALEKNEIDVGSMSYSVFKEAQKRNPHLIFWAYPGPCVALLDINIHKYPLSLKEVRWAISYAINRTKLVYLQEGLAYPAHTWFPKYKRVQKFINPELIKKYDCTVYDPNKSIEILKSLGFKRGPDGVWVTPNGTRLEFELQTGVPAPPYWLSVAEDLNKIGIKVKVKPLEWAVRWSNHARLHYDMWASWAQFPAVATPYTWYDHFSSEYLLPIGQEAPEGFNRIRFSNATYDKILNELAGIPDEDPRAYELYNKLLEILLQELPRIPLTGRLEYVILNDYYWTNWPDSWGGENPYTQAQWWWSKFLFVFFNIRSRFLPPVLPPKRYVTVWFTAHVDAFKGADGKMYGPFEAGEYAKIPKEDAESLIKKGLASYTPPLPKGVEEILRGTREEVKALRSDIKALTKSIESISGAIAALSMAIYAAVILSLIATIVSIVTLLKMLGKL